MSRIIHVGVRLSKFVYVLYGDDSESTRLTPQKIRNPAEDSSLPRAGDEILTTVIIFPIGNFLLTRRHFKSTVTVREYFCERIDRWP
jgi:hypothetical protein